MFPPTIIGITMKCLIGNGFPYRVSIYPKKAEDRELAHLWCKETFDKNIFILYDTFYFDTEEERSMFLLRWSS